MSAPKSAKRIMNTPGRKVVKKQRPPKKELTMEEEMMPFHLQVFKPPFDTDSDYSDSEDDGGHWDEKAEAKYEREQLKEAQKGMTPAQKKEDNKARKMDARFETNSRQHFRNKLIIPHLPEPYKRLWNETGSEYKKKMRLKLRRVKDAEARGALAMEASRRYSISDKISFELWKKTARMEGEILAVNNKNQELLKTIKRLKEKIDNKNVDFINLKNNMSLQRRFTSDTEDDD